MLSTIGFHLQECAVQCKCLADTCIVFLRFIVVDEIAEAGGIHNRQPEPYTVLLDI